MTTLGSCLIFSLSISLCRAAGRQTPDQDSEEYLKRLLSSGTPINQTAHRHVSSMMLEELELAAETIEYNIAQIGKQMQDFEDVKRKIEGMNPGQTYTRWGKPGCPESAEVVYSGFAGGSHYEHSGGAADYICLPPHPKYSKTIVGMKLGSAGGLVYGAEYETSDGDTDIWKKDLHSGNMGNMNVPCAVCMTNRSSVLMIPGTYDCVEIGWTQEYFGYLSSGKWDQASATEFVCVDFIPTGIGSDENQDGKLFYLVEGVCGSLPCNSFTTDYRNGAELACAVCSK